MRLLLTGTGRCGTGYCVELLRSVGIDCRHEGVWTPQAALSGGASWPEEIQAEASWMAVPHLREETTHAHVIVVVREPFAVARSFLALGFFAQDHEWRAVVERFAPRVFDERSEQEQALAYWLRWNYEALLWADEVVSIESLQASDLLRWSYIVGMPAEARAAEDAIRATPRDVNAKREAKRPMPPPRWEAIRPPLWHSTLRLARALGYA